MSRDTGDACGQPLCWDPGHRPGSLRVLRQYPLAGSIRCAERTAPVSRATTVTCIGSAKFVIEAHEAPPDEFPGQPSQKD